MEIITSLLTCLGANGILLFLVQRYFKRRDQREETDKEQKKELFRRIDTALETLRLLAYHRMSWAPYPELLVGFWSPAS